MTGNNGGRGSAYPGSADQASVVMMMSVVAKVVGMEEEDVFRHTL